MAEDLTAPAVTMTTRKARTTATGAARKIQQKSEQKEVALHGTNFGKIIHAHQLGALKGRATDTT